jgi:hypothetical protein
LIKPYEDFRIEKRKESKRKKKVGNITNQRMQGRKEIHVFLLTE